MIKVMLRLSDGYICVIFQFPVLDDVLHFSASFIL